MSNKEITTIIPILNEEENILEVLRRIPNYSEVIVVDNGSTDKGPQIAIDAGYKVISEPNRGKGNAIKAGISYVESPYIAVIDGDNTYNGMDISRVLLSLQQGNDYVLGEREYLAPGAMTESRKLGNKVMTWAFNRLYGTKFKDILTGLYGFRTDWVKSIDIYSMGFTIEVDLLSAAVLTGQKVDTFGITYTPRRGGEAKTKVSDALRILTFMTLRKGGRLPVNPVAIKG